MHQASVIALTGKGGVGKTSLSAAIVRVLTEAHPEAKILAIDADPAIGLSVALGVEVKETLDEIRLRVAKDVTEGLQDTQDILAEAKFRIFEAMQEQKGFAFLAIGRPEAAGCYCAINTYLRQVISLLIHDYDYVVVDSEAGIEQVNRRVLEKVTHLVFVTDASKKGTQVIQTVKRVADELVMYERCGAVVNRVTDPSAMDFVDTGDIPILAVIGEDDRQTEFDILGKSVFDLPEDADILRGTEKALRALDIL